MPRVQCKSTEKEVSGLIKATTKLRGERKKKNRRRQYERYACCAFYAMGKEVDDPRRLWFLMVALILCISFFSISKKKGVWHVKFQFSFPATRLRENFGLLNSQKKIRAQANWEINEFFSRSLKSRAIVIHCELARSLLIFPETLWLLNPGFKAHKIPVFYKNSPLFFIPPPPDDILPTKKFHYFAKFILWFLWILLG